MAYTGSVYSQQVSHRCTLHPESPNGTFPGEEKEKPRDRDVEFSLPGSSPFPVNLR
ncbi:hypothetical protein ZHAS_00010580 [Anopheles sinensis]|uniref:Uncharacterized protein n=1 Tax=Anopheles sinensis TaxID=74873 RepID=A0A084VXY3_ANOSI|nr:hypothetical protein ZHAS_00010580 [Anopheles sinensis]